jgi:branched-chain amino acid transport system permease protein
VVREEVVFDMFLEAFIPGFTQGCIYALVALGFVVLFSVTKMYHIMIGEFGMAGGMIGASLYAAHVPLYASVIVSVLATTAISAALWWLVFRRPFAKGTSIMSLKLITIALIPVSAGVGYLVWGTNYRELPPFSASDLSIGTVHIDPQAPWIWGVLLLVVVGLSFIFDHTMLGKALRASADQPVGARLVGINPNSMAFYAFTLAGALGAIAGVVVVPITMTYYGNGVFLTLSGLLAAMAGGPNRAEGAIIGGLFLGIIQSLAGAFISSKYMTVITLACFILILLIRPQGILGVREEEV